MSSSASQSDRLPGRNSKASADGRTLSVRAKDRPRIFSVGGLTVNLKTPPQEPQFSLSGIISDASSSRAIAGAVVELQGSPDEPCTTNSRGQYMFDGLFAAGYTVKASKDGYVAHSSPNIDITNADIVAGTVGDVFLSPTLPESSYRIVISWGALPTDLDSTMIVEGYKVNHATPNKMQMVGGAKITLDCDVRNGYGPETMSVDNLPQSTGDVKHYLNNYSKDASFAVSDAKAILYGSSGILDEIAVPRPTSDAEIVWVTWVLHRAGGFTRINKLMSTPPAAP